METLQVFAPLAKLLGIYQIKVSDMLYYSPFIFIIPAEVHFTVLHDLIVILKNQHLLLNHN